MANLMIIGFTTIPARSSAPALLADTAVQVSGSTVIVETIQ